MRVYTLNNMYHTKEEWYKYLLPKKWDIYNEVTLYRWFKWSML